jgi:hypothetical protein
MGAKISAGDEKKRSRTRREEERRPLERPRGLSDLQIAFSYTR